MPSGSVGCNGIARGLTFAAALPDVVSFAAGAAAAAVLPLQGLFHPARKVRQTYWKVYNNLYIGSQDSLVAFQPRFPDTADGANTYVRHELDILL
jgi:splicing factor 3B subunit 1